MPQKHPKTERIGGPGASHENRKEPEKSQLRNEKPADTKSWRHSGVSGGGGGMMLLNDDQRQVFQDAQQESNDKLRELEEKLRAACSQVFEGVGDSLRQRLSEIAKNFTPPTEPPSPRAKGASTGS